MGDTFRYVTITRELVSEISDYLAAGKSVVALGHRNSGKVFLKDKLHEALINQGFTSLVSVKFQGSKTLSSNSEALQRIREGVKASTGTDTPGDDIEGQGLLLPILKLAHVRGSGCNLGSTTFYSHTKGPAQRAGWCAPA